MAASAFFQGFGTGFFFEQPLQEFRDFLVTVRDSTFANRLCAHAPKKVRRPRATPAQITPPASGGVIESRFLDGCRPSPPTHGCREALDCGDSSPLWRGRSLLRAVRSNVGGISNLARASAARRRGAACAMRDVSGSPGVGSPGSAPRAASCRLRKAATSRRSPRRQAAAFHGLAPRPSTPSCYSTGAAFNHAPASALQDTAP